MRAWRVASSCSAADGNAAISFQSIKVSKSIPIKAIQDVPL